MRRPRVSSLSLPILLFAIPALSPAEEHHLRPGEYEMTTEMKMEGVDRQVPGGKVRRCFTEEDVKDHRRLAEAGEGRNRDCEKTDVKVNGNRVSWAMTCKQGAKGTAEMVVDADGFDMTLNMENPGGPHGPMKMKIHTTAKRTGDCSK